ncbi:hypothetical protein V6N11_077698 [Hibiscus sabdariffa]|uniref:RNase H type-1 domain-containing protein n=1 Tax=Hibiscus sabdariffa TaxID=183260 RepID=A0ABR2TEQ6_9ROSI
MARHYNEHSMQVTTPVHCLAQKQVWSRPPFGWICLNVDGTVLPSTNMGSAGGLVRDTDGRWLLGFYKFMGIISPLCVELWAIYVGLRVAWDNGFEYVQVQSDCLEAVKLLLDHNRDCSSLSLVRAIDLYRRKCWIAMGDIKFVWDQHDIMGSTPPSKA